MKVIIAGSRDLTMTPGELGLVVADAKFPITEVVSGCAAGIDTAGEMWAASQGIPVRHFPADWARYGRAAGPRRNREMATYADALIAIWDGTSVGTQHMIRSMVMRGKPHFIFPVKPQSVVKP